MMDSTVQKYQTDWKIKVPVELFNRYVDFLGRQSMADALPSGSKSKIAQAEISRRIANELTIKDYKTLEPGDVCTNQLAFSGTRVFTQRASGTLNLASRSNVDIACKAVWVLSCANVRVEDDDFEGAIAILESCQYEVEKASHYDLGELDSCSKDLCEVGMVRLSYLREKVAPLFVIMLVALPGSIS